MKTIWMRMICVFALCMSFSLYLMTVKTNVQAADINYGYEYEELEDGTVEITRFKFQARYDEDEDEVYLDLIIPAQLDGKTVTHIGDGAFELYGDVLNSVVIPDSVTYIGENAFNYSNMTEITIPDSVTYIGKFAFWVSNELKDIWYTGSKEQLEDICIEEYNDAFFSATIHCTNGDLDGWTQTVNPDYQYEILEDRTIEITRYSGNDMDVKIPSKLSGKSVTSIGEYAFSSCNNMTRVEIPDSVVYIGNYAFHACTGLTSLTIPNSVTSIGSYAFYNCTSLTSVLVPSSINSIGEHVFDGCGSLASLIIPDSVTSIGSCAFIGCKGLKTLIIPVNVTSIGSSAFSYCDSLSSITIPNNVTSIGAYAFSWNEGLTSVTLSDGMKSLENGIFYNCPNLRNIIFPNSVTSIGANVFSGCSKLTDIYYAGNKQQWAGISVGDNNKPLENVIIHCSDGDIVQSENTAVLPDSSNTKPAITMGAGNVQLAKIRVVYNGKSQTPSVTVKDSSGNIVSAVNYTVSYANNKNVGKATVMVIFKGSYSGTVSKAFEIVPKGTSITKLTAKKKGFTVKWKKQKTQTSGYEIQYSTYKNFKVKKAVTNIKITAESKTILKLKAKKKYYVRIRAYKTVKGKKYYSTWSKAKTVTPKK